MSTAVLDEVLARGPSPFSDAVLPNAYFDTPDVPSIHAEARRRVEHLVEVAARDRRITMQVITGEAGEGKTHLLAWLRRTAEERWFTSSASRPVLAPIEPLRVADQPFHHILGEAVRGLRRPLPIIEGAASDVPASALEHILWRVLRAALKEVAGPEAPEALRILLNPALERRPATFVNEATAAWDTALPVLLGGFHRARLLAGLDPEIFRVVARFPCPERRADLLDWLGGVSLTDDRLAMLGTRLVLDDEGDAKRGLDFLLRLGAVAGVPIILAFDQIEGVQRLGSEGVNELLKVLAELFGAGGSAVLLVFCQAQVWPLMRDAAPQHVRDRLQGEPELHLEPLGAEQAAELVQCRLAHFWRGHDLVPPDPFYPFTRTEVLARVHEARLSTPRRILRYFRDLPPKRVPAVGPAAPEPPPAPAEVVRRRFADLLTEEQQARRDPEARAQIAAGMTRAVLETAAKEGLSIGGVQVESARERHIGTSRLAGTHAVLRRGAERRSLYLEANNSASSGRSVSATVERLAKSLVDADSRALLLRESGLRLPDKAAEDMERLRPRGAVLWLREDELAPLSAFERLLNAAAAGDISVSEPDARRLIASGEAGASLELPERIVAQAFDGSPLAAAAPAADVSAALLDHLRRVRAVEPLPHLIERLGRPEAEVQAAVEALRARQMLDLLWDQGRVPLVVLRPEALATGEARP